jgi:hypothetical protein
MPNPVTNNMTEPLKAPFPYFGGKSRAAEIVWEAFGRVDNYVEPFAGSAAMLLGAPDGTRVETINDADGFVANFWRAIAQDPDEVAYYADWPVNEADLFARHSWLVRQSQTLLDLLHGDPEFYDPKIAGWWCWGACNWIGSGWCSGKGPWVHDGEKIIDSRKLPHLAAGKGINRQLPHLGDAGRGLVNARSEFIHGWMRDLHNRLRDVRITCGDWLRVVNDSVTTRHGITALFLDPPYSKGKMDYAVGGVGTDLPMQVQAWCAENGRDSGLRIVLCGHAGEHDALLSDGWHLRTWTARGGYAQTDDAKQNAKDETLWCSPACTPAKPPAQYDLLAAC